MINHAPDGTPTAFADLPEEKFPVALYGFGPEGEQVMGPIVIEPYVATRIPGLGPGKVRYLVFIYGDGTAQLSDDPTYGGAADGVGP